MSLEKFTLRIKQLVLISNSYVLCFFLISSLLYLYFVSFDIKDIGLLVLLFGGVNIGLRILLHQNILYKEETDPIFLALTYAALFIVMLLMMIFGMLLFLAAI